MARRYARIVRKTISQTEGWFDVIREMPLKVRGGVTAEECERITIGVDPSITGTGLAVFRDGELVHYKAWTEIKTLYKKHSDVLCWYCPPKGHRSLGDRARRIWMVVDWILQEIDQATMHGGRTAVAIEGYAHSARSRSMSDLHELGGQIKRGLLTRGIPFRIYDPLSIKIAATGEAMADKGDIKIACLQKLDLSVTKYGKAGENISDACMIGWLLEQERALRDGRVELKHADPNVRRVMLRTTKPEPVAFISLPLIHQKTIAYPEPLL